MDELTSASISKTYHISEKMVEGATFNQIIFQYLNLGQNVIGMSGFNMGLRDAIANHVFTRFAQRYLMRKLHLGFEKQLHGGVASKEGYIVYSFKWLRA